MSEGRSIGRAIGGPNQPGSATWPVHFGSNRRRNEQTNSSLRVTLIEILVARRAFETAVDLLPPPWTPTRRCDRPPCPRSANWPVRNTFAAWYRASSPPEGREREAAEKAVMTVCSRITPAEQQAEPLLAVMETLTEADRTALLPALGRVGGPAALKTVKAAIAATDRTLHEAGLRALCNWPNASVAPDLLSWCKRMKTPGIRSPRCGR